MQARIIILLYILQVFLAQESNAAIITVNEPGGLFTSIQPAVNTCSNWDTVLVYPGIYYENLQITRPVTLASLYLITGNTQYIDSTVIDGQGDASCMTIRYSDNCVICGFTITHGGGDEYGYGGGIYAAHSSICLDHCIIKDNHAELIGGGSYAWESNLSIINCSFVGNSAVFSGGGLDISYGNIYLSGSDIINNYGGFGGGMIVSSSGVNFDTLHCSSIYDNFGHSATDLALNNVLEPSLIVIDTFSVSELDSYSLFNPDSTLVAVLYGKHEIVYGDLFVSPSGNNQNSGTSLSEPLQSLWLAMLKIKSDSNITRTIHLFPGTFSPSTTGEHFPMGFKNNILLKGARKEETFIDGDSLSYIFDIYGLENVMIRDLTIRRGIGERHPSQFLRTPGLMKLLACKNVNFTNIALMKGYSSYAAAVDIDRSENLLFDSTDIHDNFGCSALRLNYTDYYEPVSSTYQFINCSFHHNLPMYGYYYGDGGAVFAQGSESDVRSHDVQFINCEFHHNKSFHYVSGYPTSPCLLMRVNGTLSIANCTFTENSGQENYYEYMIQLQGLVKADVYNSVFFGNEGNNFALYNYNLNDPGEECDLEVYHSLLEKGPDDIFIYYPSTVILFDSSNLEGDPLFKGTGEYPYQLAATSPCIDAGAPDLPPGISLPPIDLAGNPRIFNQAVDMGAYEYNEFVWVPGNDRIEAGFNRVLVFPNPFSSNSKMIFKLEDDEVAFACIYSMTGTKVKSWNVDPSTSFIVWNGCDDSGHSLPDGAYLLRVIYDHRKDFSKILIKSR